MEEHELAKAILDSVVTDPLLNAYPWEQCDIFRTMAKYYLDVYANVEAVDYFFRCIELGTRIGDQTCVGVSLLNLMQLYHEGR